MNLAWLAISEALSGTMAERDRVVLIDPHRVSFIRMRRAASTPDSPDSISTNRRGTTAMFSIGKKIRHDTGRDCGSQKTSVFAQPGPILAFKYAASSMPESYIAVLFIKPFVKMRVIPTFLRLCFKTLPFTLTFIVRSAPGALAAPSFEALPLAKRQALLPAGPFLFDLS